MNAHPVAGSLGCSVAALGGAERRGRIAALFANSAHLVTDDGEYLTLGDTTLPPHPYSILWKGFSPRPEIGWELTVTTDGVFHGGRRLVSFRGVRLYSPPVHARPMAGGEARRLCLTATCAAASVTLSEGMFHALFSAGSGPAPRAAALHQDGVLEHGLAAQGRRVASHMAAALRGSDWEAFCRAAEALAGMGAGLTPAGDDFLAGVLSALRFHGQSRKKDVLPPYVGQKAVTMADARTSRFSAFLLRCSAVGRIARPLADWLYAVHCGNVGRAAALTPSIAALGHTSGLDTLAGMVLALRNIPGDAP